MGNNRKRCKVKECQKSPLENGDYCNKHKFLDLFVINYFAKFYFWDRFIFNICFAAFMIFLSFVAIYLACYPLNKDAGFSPNDYSIEEGGNYLPKPASSEQIGMKYPDANERIINLVEQAEFDFNNENYEKVKETYISLLVIHPDISDFYFALGSANLMLNQLDSALANYKESVRLEPENHFYRTGYGFTLHHTLKYEQAIYQYKRALEIEPKDRAVLINLAAVYSDKGDFIEAKNYYLKSIKGLSKESTDIYSMALSGIGSIFYEQDSINQALDYFNKAIEYDSLNVFVLMNVGHSYCKKGNYTAGITYFKNVLTINPDFCDAKYSLIEALKLNGERKKAEELLIFFFQTDIDCISRKYGYGKTADSIKPN